MHGQCNMIWQAIGYRFTAHRNIVAPTRAKTGMKENYKPFIYKGLQKDKKKSRIPLTDFYIRCSKIHCQAEKMTYLYRAGQEKKGSRKQAENRKKRTKET